jgi:hypothetical protein
VLQSNYENVLHTTFAADALTETSSIGNIKVGNLNAGNFINCNNDLFKD